MNTSYPVFKWYFSLSKLLKFQFYQNLMQIYVCFQYFLPLAFDQISENQPFLLYMKVANSDFKQNSKHFL